MLRWVGDTIRSRRRLNAAQTARVENVGVLVASGLIAVTVGVSLFTLVILLSAEFLRRLLGDVGLSIATRILGLLVASIGVQFVIAGLSNVIVNSIVPAVLPQLHG